MGTKCFGEKQKGWAWRAREPEEAAPELALKSGQDNSGEGCGHRETQGQQSLCDPSAVCSGGGGRRPAREPWPLGSSLIPCLCDLLPDRCKVSSGVVS